MEKHVGRATRIGPVLLCALSAGIPAPLYAQQQATEQEMAEANNPLASSYALNLQNYFAPSLYDVPD